MNTNPEGKKRDKWIILFIFLFFVLGIFGFIPIPVLLLPNGGSLHGYLGAAPLLYYALPLLFILVGGVAWRNSSKLLPPKNKGEKGPWG